MPFGERLVRVRVEAPVVLAGLQWNPAHLEGQHHMTAFGWHGQVRVDSGRGGMHKGGPTRIPQLKGPVTITNRYDLQSSPTPFPDPPFPDPLSRTPFPP